MKEEDERWKEENVPNLCLYKFSSSRMKEQPPMKERWDKVPRTCPNWFSILAFQRMIKYKFNGSILVIFLSAGHPTLSCASSSFISIISFIVCSNQSVNQSVTNKSIDESMNQ